MKRVIQSFLVPVQEIRDKGYDLSINKYKKSKYTQIEYEPVEKMLDDVDTLEEQFAEELSDLRSLLARRE